MSLYASLEDVRSELNAENTVGDRDVVGYIRTFSRRIDALLKQKGNNFFVPRIAQKSILVDGLNINSDNRTLELRTPNGVIAPILSMSAASIGNQALTIGTNVQLYPTNPSPYTALQLIGTTFNSWYDWCNSTWGTRYVTVTGAWGYHSDYDHAWVATSALAEDITDTVKTFDVTTLEGTDESADDDGIPAIISVGSVIQIGAEWMNVSAVNTTVVMGVTTYTVTVKRAVNGSTAAAHLEDDVISVYSVDSPIRRAVVRQSAFMYARKGAFDTVRISDFSTVTFPTDILDEVNGLIELYSNL